MKGCFLNEDWGNLLPCCKSIFLQAFLLNSWTQKGGLAFFHFVFNGFVAIMYFLFQLPYLCLKARFYSTYFCAFYLFLMIYGFANRSDLGRGLVCSSGQHWDSCCQKTTKHATRLASSHQSIRGIIATQTLILYSFGSGVMNCNREMIIMMIIIISVIIAGQSQGAVMEDISCDLWLICCEAGSSAMEPEFHGVMHCVYPSVFVHVILRFYKYTRIVLLLDSIIYLVFIHSSGSLNGK